MARKIEIPCPKCGSRDTMLTRDTIEYHCFDCGYYFGQDDANEYGWLCNGVKIVLAESEDGNLSFTLRRNRKRGHFSDLGKWFDVTSDAEIEELCRLAENFDKEWQARVGQEVEQ